MQDKTIDNALLALRKQIIRGDGEGLAHIEALLTLRGVKPPDRYWNGREAKRSGMRRLVTEALAQTDGTMRELVPFVARRRPELSHKQAYVRTGCCLARMKRKGMVVREGRVWSQARLDGVSEGE